MSDGFFRRFNSIDYRRMPWKNGGGETTEIAVFPENAGLADFDWRISMATVASDGPFSVFPGIDRTLSILDGAGMSLFIEGREAVVLTTKSQPLPFPADAPTSATLVDGPITDLNVMTRRDSLSHEVRRLAVGGARELVLDASTTLLFCESGSLDVDSDRERTALSDRDCLLVTGLGGTRLTLKGQAHLFVISIRNA
jgi:environmental stress-induced protein Ves